MIDPSVETLLTPKQVCKLPAFVREGRPVGLKTVYRWFDRGVLVRRDGIATHVTLESVRLPAGRRTSQEAVQRFINALNREDALTPHDRDPGRSGAASDVQAKALAAARLDAFGI